MPEPTFPAPPEDGVPCQANPDLWWPQTSEDRTAAWAKAACASCPILDGCLEWAVHNESHGIWGGTTAVERTRIRKARQLPAPPLFPRRMSGAA